ncbi:MAG TPA: CHAT domain-containing protein, partial [Candidatus Paceibacterota bacterium]|nr:CHAT domain-containing protein [Candidatus Paceibacterota bacterium]
MQAGLARALSDKGDIEGAKLYYEAALRTFESVFSQQDVDEIRAGALQEVSNVYRDFTDFLLAQHEKTKTQMYLDQAFKYTELGRARVFLDMLARGRAGRVEASDNNGETAEETMRRQLAELHIKLQRVKIRSPEESKLLAQIESLRTTLSRSQQSKIQGRSIVAQTTVAQPVTLRDVQSALSSDSIFLQYSASAGGSLLWAITKDQARVFRLPDEEAEGLLNEFLATVKLPLTGPDELAAHIQLGTRLYQMLLEPADKLFRGKKHLIIAPDGPLYYLPFEALITPKSS